MPAACTVCRAEIPDGVRLVTVQARDYAPHCSDVCLRETIARQRAERAAQRRAWTTRLAALGLVAATAAIAWRHRTPPTAAISAGWPDLTLEEASPITPPVYYGPAWPPTDDDWQFAFERAPWVYPLPGPVRRPTSPDDQIFPIGTAAAGKAKDRPPEATCRTAGRCAVDLGGELWGEHVHAALGGVVDRVHGEADDQPGGAYVRLSHFGGMAFTHYFHLAATPRQIVRGARVAAGDVIGLVGDSGLPGGKRHLHFSISVRPAPAFAEVYWDPTPFMATWRLKRPTYGTVAGFAPNAR